MDTDQTLRIWDSSRVPLLVHGARDMELIAMDVLLLVKESGVDLDDQAPQHLLVMLVPIELGK